MPDEPTTNDEPKTGFSVLGEGQNAIELSYPMEDGRHLIINLGFSIQQA